VNPKKMTGKE